MKQCHDNSTPNRASYDAENQFHGSDGPSFDETIAGRAQPGLPMHRLEHELDHYFRETQRLVEYLTRCIDRLKYLRREDVQAFENSRRYFRDGIGEDLLRVWEVRMQVMLGMLRDMQMEGFEESPIII
jgi:hypothetical protein